MRYYTIYNDGLLIAENQEALRRYYNTPIFELPIDYEEGKYIIGEVEEEIVNPETEETETVKVKKLVLNPNWDEEQYIRREQEFKADFFLIPNYGWFRKKPKGYSSAVESLNTAFNAVTIMGKLPANMLIFYTAPDFSKPEECTEEWLIEHQTFNAEMSAQEFGTFYVGFMTSWNTQEHVNEVQ